ncbi:hypothetical protein [Cupriavidus sp. H19C3]|uniref:hypothetical protein n=1 Tax=Cupriavidus sp. H19C3 TaxID=3241603 RepID=UPI003BF89804
MAATGDAALMAAGDGLRRHLYARGAGGPWDGTVLAQGVARHAADARRRRGRKRTLPPLNPEYGVGDATPTVSARLSAER